jgi:hypothetical protein
MRSMFNAGHTLLDNNQRYSICFAQHAGMQQVEQFSLTKAAAPFDKVLVFRNI